jgi:type I restriction enzyme, S subunit
METYKRCRVQLHAQGIVLRDRVPGIEVKTKKQQVCRAGEFLVAEIDAKVGGFGIVPNELKGAIVSSHYFLFEINEDRLDRRFLDYYCRTPQFREQVEAQGSTNYAAIRPSHVLGYTIPLPPMDEQRRIVARIEELAAKIEEARRLRYLANSESEFLLAATLRSERQKLLSAQYPIDRLGNVTTVTAGGTPSRQDPTFWNGDIPWIKTGELLDGDIYGSEETITQDGVNNSSAKLFPIDTILIALYGQGQTRGRTGRLRIEATTNQACCAILPCDSLNPAFVQYWLRSLYHEMREESQGGAQPNWNGAMIKDINISLSSSDRQMEFVQACDHHTQNNERRKMLQIQCAAELNALLPSLLDKAFRGEL